MKILIGVDFSLFRYLSRRLSMFLLYLYVVLCVLPVLLIKKKISLPFRLVLGHGAVLILCHRLVVKVSSSLQPSVLVEYLNVQRLCKIGASISSCLPSPILIRNAILTCLLFERYQTIALVDALDSAVELRRKFDSVGVKLGGASLDHYPQLQVGLEQVARLFGHEVGNRMECRVRQYLAEGDYHMGLCHGDFHSRNIMRDQNGDVRVIDLDCVRFEGIIELDVIYFALELEWSASGVLWPETLATTIESDGKNIAVYLERFSVQWSEALGLVYLLDRVGQEYINYGFQYPKLKLQRAVVAIQSANDGTLELETV